MTDIRLVRRRCTNRNHSCCNRVDFRVKFLAVLLEIPCFNLSFLHVDPHIRVSAQDAKSHPTNGVLVYGMFIEGASWDDATKRLCDPRPDQIRAPAPIVHFLPEVDHTPDPGEFAVNLLEPPPGGRCERYAPTLILE